MSRNSVRAGELVVDVMPSTEMSRRDIARSFGHAAKSYDQHAVLQRSVADNLLSVLADMKHIEAVLDLGCGTGYCSEKILPMVPSATFLALDLAYPMLKSIQNKTGGLSLLCADAEALPVQTACIDLLVSSLAIQWCRDLSQLFAELFRVLKPGGTALLSTFGPASLQEVKAAWAKVDSYTHVNRFASEQELNIAASNAGFSCNISSELMQNNYESLYSLSRELKGIGAHNINHDRPHGLTSPRKFKQAADFFISGKKQAKVSWEIYYLILKKPKNA